MLMFYQGQLLLFDKMGNAIATIVLRPRKRLWGCMFRLAKDLCFYRLRLHGLSIKVTRFLSEGYLFQLVENIGFHWLKLSVSIN